MSSGQYTSYIISPKHVTNSSVSCVSFDYFVLVNHTALDYSMFLQVYVIPNALKDYVVWKGMETKVWGWNRAQIEVNETDFRIMFNAILSDGLKAIDNVQVSDGSCQALECPKNGTSCKDQYCIPRELLCDKNFDCDDGSDEKTYCGLSLSCDFSTDYACGYMNKTLFPPWQTFSSMRTSQGVVYDYTTKNSSGSFIGIQTNLPYWTASLRSPSVRIQEKSCLKFYYMGSATGLFVTAMHDGINMTVFNDSMFSNTVWRPGQFELDKAEDGYLLFDVKFNISNPEAFFGLDDVTLTPGKCLPLDCPSTMLQCGRDNICVNRDVLCNYVHDCPSGDDESELFCPNTISCDFENLYLCGYNKYSSWFRRHGFYYFLPMMDHTYGNISGHYMTFNSTTPRSAVFKSPKQNLTEDGCIHFFYNMEGKHSAELKVNVIQNGMKNISWYGNGLNVERDEWKEAWFPVRAGVTEIEFEAFADVYFFQSGVIAIDDVSFSNGTCPSTIDKCNFDEFECIDSGVCIPYYHVNDQYRYCLDQSDEETSGSTVILGSLLSCTFEPGDACFLTNSTTDNHNWYIHSGSTPSSTTGPNSAYSGLYYTYFEVSIGNTGETAMLESQPLYYINATCLRFYYHMYGTDIGHLAVYLNSTRKWIKSYNQGNTWNKQEIFFQSLTGQTIYIEATRGYSYQGDIALDNIALLPAELCGQTSNNTSIDFSENYDVRLVGGHDRSYGRLEIMWKGKYYVISSYRWNELNSKVVCKQLGYTKKHKTYYNSEYGNGRAPFINMAFFCIGNEAHMKNCSSSYYSYNPFTVALACSNTDCFHGDIACPDIDGANSNVTCIASRAWCDGQFDCPGGQDELNCANCTDSEFECQDHTCISGHLKCDGIDHCMDGSDEYKCVHLFTSNNTVKINRRGEWYWLCYNNVDRTVASHLCSIAGYGSIDAYHSVPWNDEGLTVYPTDNPDGVVINHRLVYTRSCSLLGLTCETNPQCGLQSLNHPGIQTFVINGEDAVLGEWPWHVALFVYDSSTNRDTFYCGGSLIHPEWVITAAHCVEYSSRRTYYIYAGSIYQSKFKIEAQRRNLSSSPFLHRDYTSFRYGNDIALLRLSQPVNINDKVRTVCLSPYLRETYDNCYVTGWGKTHVDIHIGNVFPDRLQEVKVQANKDFNWCNKSHIDLLRMYVVPDGICVDNRNQYSPVCNGDSGGPLVCQNEEGRWELVGVTSYGYRGCFKDHIPDIYASVSYHWDWINQITSKINIVFVEPGITIRQDLGVTFLVSS
ncbi:hypothetical protein KUTeg_000592 [Tegillarca granosa]|uniref:Uncharacterized protein n=1 Tax=Tegillarca granosa TaxID=220873 RepID=A0ABQ9G134_TEGGR|nr:hypothetical protein KUTeg_000592 [Tegillarca granosa]